MTLRVVSVARRVGRAIHRSVNLLFPGRLKDLLRRCHTLLTRRKKGPSNPTNNLVYQDDVTNIQPIPAGRVCSPMALERTPKERSEGVLPDAGSSGDPMEMLDATLDGLYSSFLARPSLSESDDATDEEDDFVSFTLVVREGTDSDGQVISEDRSDVDGNDDVGNSREYTPALGIRRLPAPFTIDLPPLDPHESDYPSGEPFSPSSYLSNRHPSPLPLVLDAESPTLLNFSDLLTYEAIRPTLVVKPPSLPDSDDQEACPWAYLDVNLNQEWNPRIEALVDQVSVSNRPLAALRVRMGDLSKQNKGLVQTVMNRLVPFATDSVEVHSRWGVEHYLKNKDANPLVLLLHGVGVDKDVRSFAYVHPRPTKDSPTTFDVSITPWMFFDRAYPFAWRNLRALCLADHKLPLEFCRSALEACGSQLESLSLMGISRGSSTSTWPPLALPLLQEPELQFSIDIENFIGAIQFSGLSTLVLATDADYGHLMEGVPDYHIPWASLRRLVCRCDSSSPIAVRILEKTPDLETLEWNGDCNGPGATGVSLPHLRVLKVRHRYCQHSPLQYLLSKETSYDEVCLPSLPEFPIRARVLELTTPIIADTCINIYTAK